MTAPLQPQLGIGLGLRPEHYEAILDSKPKIDWFEIITENFMVEGGSALHYLDKITERYPVVMHGVSLSLGGSDPLDENYLTKLKALAVRSGAKWVSDHLCWTTHNNLSMHDLYPLPYMQSVIEHVADRIKRVQDVLGQPFVIENVSSYVTFKASVMSEWDFINEILERADCHMLLDVNNVYVSAFNHGFEAKEYINAIPVDRVQQFHLAGHMNCGTHIIDTHDHPIIEEVWQLYALAAKRFVQASTLIERDDNIPPLEEVLAECDKARTIATEAYASAEEVCA